MAGPVPEYFVVEREDVEPGPSAAAAESRSLAELELADLVGERLTGHAM